MKRMMMFALAVAALCVSHAVSVNAQAKAKPMNASGTVKAVTGNSLTVTAGGKDMTFRIDNTTRFVGKGLGTKAKGAPISPTDAVGTGDTVRVTYHDMGGTLHATNVSITMKATVGK